MKSNMIATLVLVVSIGALAKTKTYCGKRDGTAGNAFLVDQNNTEILTLAIQGGDHFLMDQADSFITPEHNGNGDSGMQNGRKYCVVGELDENGVVTKITGAYPWRKKRK